jgi:hypothetical protein
MAGNRPIDSGTIFDLQFKRVSFLFCVYMLCCLKVLEIMEGVTAELSGQNYPTLSLVLPNLIVCLEKLRQTVAALKNEEAAASDGDVKAACLKAVAVCNALETNITERFGPETVGPHIRPFLVASYLDPRFKKLRFMKAIKDQKESSRAKAVVMHWVREDLKLPTNAASNTLKRKLEHAEENDKKQKVSLTRARDSTTHLWVLVSCRRRHLRVTCSQTPPASRDRIWKSWRKIKLMLCLSMSC